MRKLEDGQKPVVMARYPHLLAEDTETWTRFLQSEVTDIQRVWYDIRIGAPVLLKDEASEMERKIAAAITRKRIDVVATLEVGTWVVEVKPYANMYALGQVITYARLFKKEFEYPGQLQAVLICDDYDDDLLDEFDEFEILVFRNE